MLGSRYALVALGYTMVCGIIGVINFSESIGPTKSFQIIGTGLFGMEPVCKFAPILGVIK